MNATELMIGDWVFLKNGKVLQTCKVTVIGNATQNRNNIGKYVCLDTSDEFPTCIFEIDKISPIPLTPEILEKNGFKEDKYGQMILDEELGSSEIYIVLQEGDECYWWTVSNELIAKIRYVHELQHVFRLCKIEKEIEL